MDLDQFPLGMFEVDCDGSACASPGTGRHIHPPQTFAFHSCVASAALGLRVTVRNGRRTGYSKAEGITRLVMVDAEAAE